MVRRLLLGALVTLAAWSQIRDAAPAFEPDHTDDPGDWLWKANFSAASRAEIREQITRTAIRYGYPMWPELDEHGWFTVAGTGPDLVLGTCDDNGRPGRDDCIRSRDPVAPLLRLLAPIRLPARRRLFR